MRHNNLIDIPVLDDGNNEFQILEEKMRSAGISMGDIREAVLNAKAMERHKIGDELHDNVAQILSAAKLIIHTAITEKSRGPVFLQHCAQLIDTAILEIRKITCHLTSDSKTTG